MYQEKEMEVLKRYGNKNGRKLQIDGQIKTETMSKFQDPNNEALSLKQKGIFEHNLKVSNKLGQTRNTQKDKTKIKLRELLEFEESDGCQKESDVLLTTNGCEILISKENVEQQILECKEQEKPPKSEKVSMHSLERAVLEKIHVKFYMGKCYVYNKRNWEVKTKDELLQEMRSALDKETLEAIERMYSYTEAANYMKINPKLQIKESEMKNLKHKTFISCKNCVIDAETMERYNHSSDFLLFFSCNIKFRKKPADTPAWDEFLDCVSNGDSKVTVLIKEVIGYLMLHSNDAKAFFVMGTAPDSGKSVLGQWIAQLFDSKYVAHIPLQEMGSRFALSRAANIALNICMDISAKKVPDDAVGVMKQITGESELLIEQKYQSNEDINHHFHCLFGTNADISLSREDLAFFNRLVYIPFTKTIPRDEQDKLLLEKLVAESDDFASKCIYAVHEVIKRNYVFTETKEGQHVLYAWTGNVSLHTEAVVKECFEFTYNERDVLSSKECYKLYEEKSKEYDYGIVSYDIFRSYMVSSRGLKHARTRVNGSKNALSCLVGVKRRDKEDMIIPITHS